MQFHQRSELTQNCNPPHPCIEYTNVPTREGCAYQDPAANADWVLSEDKPGEIDQELVIEALHDRRYIARAISLNSGVYRGGVIVFNPELVFAIMGDTVRVGDLEFIVREVLERGRLPCGAPVCKVKVVDTVQGRVKELFVVPEGVQIANFQASEPGQYKRCIGQTSVMVARIYGCAIDPTLIRRPPGCLGGIRYRFKQMGRVIKRTVLCCCYVDTTYVIRVDRSLIQYLHHQRLETSTGLGTAQVDRIIESAAIKHSPHISTSTLNTSVGYFIKNGKQGLSADSKSHCIIQDKSNFPALFDPEFTVVAVNQGEFNSSETPTEVAIKENNFVTVKQAKGTTFTNGLLVWDTPYHKPIQLYCYGPHPSTNVLIYSNKSTHNASEALKRLVRQREHEITLRVNADFLLMTVLRYPNPRPATRRMARKFKAFTGWGLDHNEYLRTRGRHKRSFVCSMELTAEVTRRYYASVVDAMLLSKEPEQALWLPKASRMEIFANLEHIKKAERMMTFEQMMAMPAKFDGMFLKDYVTGKVKIESGKAQKAALPRQYISLGCERTLFAPQIAEIYKSWCDHTYTVIHESQLLDIPVDHPQWPNPGYLPLAELAVPNRLKYKCHIRFWKTATRECMDEWADQVYTATDYNPGDRYINQHSDDGHINFQCSVGGKLSVINCCADVSKCDLSHSPGTFVLLARVLVEAGFEEDVVTALFEQLQCDIMVKHPNNKVDEYIRFAVEYILLMTGSTLTTIVNNTGCLPMLIHILSLCDGAEFSDKEDLTTAIITAGSYAGYEITVDALTITPLGEPFNPTSLAGLTFLKHFPVTAASGKWVALKDPATIIRSLGISEDQPDCVTRLRDIVLGYPCHYGNVVLDAIYDALSLPTPAYEDVVDSSYLEARYGATTQTLREGFSLLFSLRIACFVQHPGLAAVLKVGYGLGRLRGDLETGTIFTGEETQFLGVGTKTPI